MLEYNVGDVVRVKCHGELGRRIVSGRIIQTDESSILAYRIRCCTSQYTSWYMEMDIVGLDRSYKPVWSKVITKQSSIGPWDFLFCNVPDIKKVIFNNPVTIVLWTDGTKTVVKAQAIKTVKMTREVFHKLDANEVVKFIELKSSQMYTTNYRPETDSFIINVYDEFDPEKGLAMAIAKKALGNKGSYYDEFKKWLPKEEE